MNSRLYNVLNHSAIYKLAQLVLGAGAQKNVPRKIRTLLATLPNGKRLLDVGCGPESWLWKVGLDPVGLDIQKTYVESYRARGGEAHLSSADALPFKDESFSGVWCIGVFHHLPDSVVRSAIDEAIRVCSKGGYVVVMDAVMPKSMLTRPIAYLLRRMDRGEFMRTEDQLLAMFPSDQKWADERFSYAYTGLEMVAISCIKQ